MLDGLDFFRIHKSYVVNPNQIQKVSGNTIHLHNGIPLPTGRSYKESFLEPFFR